MVSAAARENIDFSLTEARMISRATVSNVPSFPKKGPVLLIAMLATAFLMAAYVLSSEILRQGGSQIRRRRWRRSMQDLRRGLIPSPRPVRRSIFSVLKRSPKVAAPAYQPGIEWTAIGRVGLAGSGRRGI